MKQYLNFLVLLSFFVLGLYVPTYANSINVESTWENNCNRVDTLDLWDGWSIQHISLQADRHVNIWRTEVYKDTERVDFHDTVFYANSRWTWWYSAPSCATHSRISTANYIDGILNLTFDSFNPQSGPWFWTYATTTRPTYNHKPLQLSIWSQEVENISISAYAIWSGFNHAIKLNLTSSGTHIWWASRRVEAFSWWRDASVWSRLRSSYYYGQRGCEVIDIDQTEEEYVINFTCELTYTKTSSAINGAWFTQTNNYEWSFSILKERYNLCNYDETLCEETLPIINSLEQYIQSPSPGWTPLEREVVELWEQIGKYQSGSWIILEASIDSENPTDYELQVDVLKVWEITPIVSQTTSFESNWNWSIIIPNLSTGSYYWQARVLWDNWKESDIIQYKDNNWEADFALYEWFEPYPFGYNFPNASLTGSILSASITEYFDTNYPFWHIKKVPGNKFDIFDSAFKEESFASNERKLMRAYENLGLNKENALYGWSCYGMAASAAMYSQYENFVDNHYANFTNNIGDEDIWSWVQALSTTDDRFKRWDTYDDNVMRTILGFQLSQFSNVNQDARKDGVRSALEIIETLNDNPNKNYLLSFRWKDPDEKHIWHLVVPYKAEWNRIYFWDNNVAYLWKRWNAYNQFIEVNDDDTWSAYRYLLGNFKTFDDISLISLEDIYNNNYQSSPIWFNILDIVYTISGKADLIVTDTAWNISWFKDWEILEEIPGVEVIIPLNVVEGEDAIENTHKQIYLSQKQDVTVEVIWKTNESYDLLIAWGDYYTKLESIETNPGQIDTFITSIDDLEINFDDAKTWEYNLIVDNFRETWTGTVYVGNIWIIPEPQKYSVDWVWLTQQTNNKPLTYSIDTNADGIYDNINTTPAFPESNQGSVSWYIYSDLNNNGLYDSWDTPKKNKQVFLDMDSDWKYQKNIDLLVKADKNGYYEFDWLATWSYRVSLKEQHEKYSSPKQWYFDIIVFNGQENEGISFGIAKKKNK